MPNPQNVCVGGYLTSGFFRVVAKRQCSFLLLCHCKDSRMLKSVLGQETRAMTEKACVAWPCFKHHNFPQKRLF